MSGLRELKNARLIVDELARRGLRPVRSYGRQATYHCPLPGHDDAGPSFTVYTDENRFMCYGCGRHGSVVDLVMALDSVGLQEAIRTLDGGVPEVRRPKSGAGRKSPYDATTAASTVTDVTPLQSGDGLTLGQLCTAKKLEETFLRSLGCRDARRNGISVVAIPYHGEAGEILAVRSRLALEGERFRWRANDKARLYGLDRLDMVRESGWVLFVEGESDCWTAWQYGLPAIGIPGKSTWRHEWGDRFGGIDTYVWQEPGADDLVERMVGDLPNLRVLHAPDGIKDISDAHVAGHDVRSLVEELRGSAHRAVDLLAERYDGELAAAMVGARPVLDCGEPLELVRNAIRAQGYGGDLRAAELTYVACTGRVLAMRPGSMPAHLLLLGPAAAGKSFTTKVVLRLMPPEAFHEIDAGSPRVLIYDDAPLAHRVVVFGEADSLPAGEDNPAASAVRNLCQDHYLHYKVTVRDAETGDYVVRDVHKPGPTTLVTTAVRQLGPQLSTRLFTLEVPDDHNQIGDALRAQAAAEIRGATPEPDRALVAYQLYLQLLAPWEVVVPFAGELAEHLASQPVESRVVRDYARLLTLIKSVTVLRHTRRRRDNQGRLVAEASDYAKVFDLVADVYRTSATGANRRVRDAVDAVSELVRGQEAPVTVTKVAGRLGCPKMTASRAVATALKGGWLTNAETRRGYPYQLGVGEPLPSEAGLLPPEAVTCNTVTAHTDRSVVLLKQKAG